MAKRRSKPKHLTAEETALFLREGGGVKKKQVNFRLTEEAVELLSREAHALGVSRTAALEVLIREYCRRDTREAERGRKRGRE